MQFAFIFFITSVVIPLEKGTEFEWHSASDYVVQNQCPLYTDVYVDKHIPIIAKL